MSDVVWTDRPELRSPIMVCAFKGWNDAGEAASAAVSFIHEHFESFAVARIDPEEFYDFTAVRPTVRLTEGRTREIDWPENTFSAAHVAGAESDLVMLQGAEPSLRWRRFTNAVISTARELGVRMVVTLGALLADVPHTRPVAITGLASDQDLVKRLGFERTTYEGPTGIVGVLHDLSIRAGLPSVSFWAAVPHYVPAGVNPKAALALVERVGSFLHVPVELKELLPATAAWEQRVSELVAENETLAEYVQRLEEAAPEEPPLPLVSGESLAAELERFLRERDGGREGST